MRFIDRLQRAVEGNRSHLCIGLDPVPARIPNGDVLAWAKGIIDATADVAACYKPNSAFFEALGRQGWEVLAETIASVPQGVPVLLDAKRGDIGNTAEAYARAAFEVLGAGAITVSPYLGRDSIEPFLAYQDRAVFVLCRTSNPGAGEFQDLAVGAAEGAQPLYEVVAQRCREWNQDGSVGLVTGATYPTEIMRVRQICPDQWLLVPGVGAQGGELEAAAGAAGGVDGTAPFLVNASRQIIYAAQDSTFAGAARVAAEALRAQIEAALQGSGRPA